MKRSLPRGYRFDNFFLDVANRQLLFDCKEVFLRPKTFETLLCLVEQHGRLVTKDDLMDTVWSETSVTPAVLAHCIAEARKALQDDPLTPRYIKTVSRVGYKFIAQATEADPEEQDAGGEGARHPSSLVVLPFLNISVDPENEYFCDGLAEELINGLTQIQDLRVVARSSAFVFKGRDTDVREIGRTLKVGTVLEGSVRKAGDRLRISVQLISADDGFHIWSEQFDRRLEDVFAIQEEISQAVMAKMGADSFSQRAAVASKVPTGNMRAYRLYLKGRSFWHRRYSGFLEKAMACFSAALEEDPLYASAYAGLSDCYLSLGIWGMAPPAQVFTQARTLSRQALEIDGDLADAHASQAVIYMLYDWDWVAAAGGLERAIALNRGNALNHLWYGHYLSLIGRMEEAIESVRTAQELDPLSPTINANVGYTLFLARQFEAAEIEIRKTLEMDPYYGVGHLYLAGLLAYQGKYGEAVEAYKQAQRHTGGMLRWAAGFAAYTCGLAGNRQAAREFQQWLEQCHGHVPSSARFFASLGVGEDDKAYQWLEKAYEERDTLLPWIGVDPVCDRLHGAPRFRDIVDRMARPSPAT